MTFILRKLKKASPVKKTGRFKITVTPTTQHHSTWKSHQHSDGWEWKLDERIAGGDKIVEIAVGEGYSEDGARREAKRLVESIKKHEKHLAETTSTQWVD